MAANSLQQLGASRIANPFPASSLARVNSSGANNALAEECRVGAWFRRIFGGGRRACEDECADMESRRRSACESRGGTYTVVEGCHKNPDTGRCEITDKCESGAVIIEGPY